jgi:stage IV sporulation protein FB
MLLQEPGVSPYDLQFRAFGFPVRVAWGFWIAAAVLGWEWSQGWNAILEINEFAAPGPFPLLLIWAAALLLSILVHELGHAVAMRYFGGDSRIVLYHFGGLAIPEGFGAWNAARRRMRTDPQSQLLISAAGPVAQILLAILVAGIAVAAGLHVWSLHWLAQYVPLPMPEPQRPFNGVVWALSDAIITPSFFWAILNLLPVMPLDGGRIMQQGLHISRHPNADYLATLVSLVVGGLVALWGFQRGQPGIGILFLLLAISNFQALQGPRIGRW